MIKDVLIMYRPTRCAPLKITNVIICVTMSVDKKVYIVTLGIFLAVIIFLSVAGNLLVCIAVYTDRYSGHID